MGRSVTLTQSELPSFAAGEICNHSNFWVPWNKIAIKIYFQFLMQYIPTIVMKRHCYKQHQGGIYLTEAKFPSRKFNWVHTSYSILFFPINHNSISGPGTTMALNARFVWYFTEVFFISYPIIILNYAFKKSSNSFSPKPSQP